ncbi:sugar phosphate isomerase/epimerase family protein [Roseospira visakhapatnamensis]|uniref:Sugar phosphate isomerase/epimerase n=1 Tax=Roseospira visakhapatnamensis TaxID=390880 RepID=A0A7W6RB33_9PROT|nr:sugar phosphate isomerase/epimerase family protein [Roseospira visakhapatnamensis]MBB4264583.1 sugar phosphate isomerase/epimerase [Roseospira visakhapatnamensis]
MTDAVLTRRHIGGLGDEAAPDLAGQVRIHDALGFGFLELRSIAGTAVADIDPASARRYSDQITAAGLEVACLASRIANWARPISGPLQEDLDELDRLATLAPIFGCRTVRIMSYPNDGLTDRAWEAEAMRRLTALVERAADRTLVLWHENCAGWAGRDPRRAVALFSAIDSPHLRALFDIGNPVAYGHDGLAYMEAVFPWIDHVHVKDARSDGDTVTFTFPGEGDARLLEILDRLWAGGYRGRISLEPHIGHIPHLRTSTDAPALARGYRAYAERFVALLGDRLQAAGGPGP